MLTTLDIAGVVTIDRLRLDFAPGLAVLTGETGAGKSILLDALGLALGARGDAGLVRTGSDAARVTAAFMVAAGHPALALLDGNGLDHEAGEVILRRQVKTDGVGRAWINDAAVSVGLLREVGSTLVEVHGQADDRGLLSPRGHRALLDAFGGHVHELADAAATHAAWRAAVTAEAGARAALAEAERDRDWLEHAAAELATLAPEPGEEEALDAVRADMRTRARLAEDLAAVDTLVSDADGGLARLRQAARRLDRLAGEHALLADALAALDRALAEADEAEAKLAAAGLALTVEPARLEAAEARLFELRGAARKHRTTVDALPALAADMAARAAALDAGAAGLAGLAAATTRARAAFVAAAAALGEARRGAVGRLDAAVAAELAPLKLGGARFRTALTPLGEAEWGPAGMERAEFEIATVPGAPFGPLAKIASGGELSRFVLALKVALAATGSAGTLIFDEIDRGVGGAVASAIGERLARLAGDAQVLVVTHSPQVAARGDAQWRISKAAGTTAVEPLDAGERREEIARMLSGAEVTAEARAQAGRLLGVG